MLLQIDSIGVVIEHPLSIVEANLVQSSAYAAFSKSGEATETFDRVSTSIISSIPNLVERTAEVDARMYLPRI